MLTLASIVNRTVIAGTGIFSHKRKPKPKWHATLGDIRAEFDIGFLLFLILQDGA
jgi:hypothetical protein